MAWNPLAERTARARAQVVVHLERRRARVPRRAGKHGFARRPFALALTIAAALLAGAGSVPALAARKHHRHHHQRRLAPRLADEHGAPYLWASGQTLHWSATAASHQYLEARRVGSTITYALIDGTTDTPPAVAGATVIYEVRPRYQPRSWSNEVKVAYPRGRRGREGEETTREREEREARERAEREAKEKAEREAKEKAEREAKELAEREAKEKAEREQREREELEHIGGEETAGAVVGKAPVGPPSPASGWHIAYGDAFGDPLGSGAGHDNTLESGEKWNGCCTNSNEVAVEQHSQARVGPEGLELVCSVGSFTVEGHTRGASCGGVRGDAFFEFNYASVGEWAVECFCRWPVDAGGADPGFWVYTGAQELDFFEGWGWNGLLWATATAGVPVVVTPYHEHFLNGVTGGLGFDPSLGFHRYTTVFSPKGGGNYLISEYIDGVFRWAFEDTIANTSDGLILTNALRERAQPDVMTVRSVAMWQDGAHAGQGIKGGGIAPGTTVK
jgi:hypothetical protein